MQLLIFCRNARGIYTKTGWDSSLSLYGLPVSMHMGQGQKMITTHWRRYYPDTTSVNAMRKVQPQGWKSRDRAPSPIWNKEETDITPTSQPKGREMREGIYLSSPPKQDITQDLFTWGAIYKHMRQGPKLLVSRNHCHVGVDITPSSPHLAEWERWFLVDWTKWR